MCPQKENHIKLPAPVAPTSITTYSCVSGRDLPNRYFATPFSLSSDISISVSL